MSSYKVLFTPLKNNIEYDSAVNVTYDLDVTDDIKMNGISRIKRDIDNGDYDMGSFIFGDITVNLMNFRGRYDTPDNPSSLFKYSRDRCKVRVDYLDRQGVAMASFNGIINEAGTRQDLIKGEIKFKILSIDSILKRIKVASGEVASGVICSRVLKQLFFNAKIRSLMSLRHDDLKLDYDLLIENGAWFTNKSFKEVIDALMIASNSVMYVDGTSVIINARREAGIPKTFYGAGNEDGRENILKIKNFNSGLHRTFNSFSIGDYTNSDQIFIDEYGLNHKKVALDFITDIKIKEKITENLLDTFRHPKKELEMDVLMEDSKDVKILDSIVIKSGIAFLPPEGEEYLTPFQDFTLGVTKFPKVPLNYNISERMVFKVIGIFENVINKTRTLKLRERGRGINDGYIYGISSRWEYFQLGVSAFTDGSDWVNPNEDARFCSFRLGITKLE